MCGFSGILSTLRMFKCDSEIEEKEEIYVK